MRKFWRSPELTPVQTMLRDLGDFGPKSDDYLQRVVNYLHVADERGLGGEAIVSSCIDLAQTYADIPEVVEVRRHKLGAWMMAREAALSVERDPITVEMKLDPIFFEAIMKGIKTFEGRAYKPQDVKNYPDLRAGDDVYFRLSRRQDDFVDDAKHRGLSYDQDMICTVTDVHYAPTVHGVFQIPRQCGRNFQPMVNGPAEFLQLERAAVYYGFPGYPEIISDHGFLGIEVENPRLVTAAAETVTACL